MDEPASFDDNESREVSESSRATEPDVTASEAKPAEPGGNEAADSPPEAEVTVRVGGRRAPVAIVAMVVLADITLYHAQGLTGPAAFLLGAAVLVFVGSPTRTLKISTMLLAALLLLLCVRLASNGTAVQIMAGFWLLSGMTFSLRGQEPFVLETLVFAAQCVPGGYEFYQAVNARMRRAVLHRVDVHRPSRWLNFGLPVLSAIVFGSIFVMANPDLVTWVSGHLAQLTESLREFLFQFTASEIVFWCAVAWLSGGLFRPVVGPVIACGPDQEAMGSSQPAALFPAFRNTLITVITLFMIYLVFEFHTLWSGQRPETSGLSDYAHEGAAWLTVALGLATLMLSMIFRSGTLADPRLNLLKRLAWVWSALNFLLAIAVYHRMLIYIDYNGMTRMRCVGLLGITSVVAGFVLVLIKIQRRFRFLWLFRRQLWVVSLACYIYLVLPIDVLVHSYNVRRVMSGDLPPIVQITSHPVDDEALSVLLPLCESSDATIRDGMRCMLSRRFERLRDAVREQSRLGWTAKQWSQQRALQRLRANKSAWDHFPNAGVREAMELRLGEYAYTWY